MHLSLVRTDRPQFVDVYKLLLSLLTVPLILKLTSSPLINGLMTLFRLFQSIGVLGVQYQTDILVKQNKLKYS